MDNQTPLSGIGNAWGLHSPLARSDNTFPFILLHSSIDYKKEKKGEPTEGRIVLLKKFSIFFLPDDNREYNGPIRNILDKLVISFASLGKRVKGWEPTMNSMGDPF